MKKILAGTVAGLAGLAIASSALAAGGGSATTNLSQVFQTNLAYSTNFVTPVSPPAGSTISSMNVSWKFNRSISGIKLELCGSVSGCQTIVSGGSGISGTVGVSGFNTKTAIQNFQIKATIVAGTTALISPALYQGGHTITVNYVP
jgi:hypothetical protein